MVGEGQVRAEDVDAGRILGYLYTLEAVRDHSCDATVLAAGDAQWLD